MTAASGHWHKLSTGSGSQSDGADGREWIQPVFVRKNLGLLIRLFDAFEELAWLSALS